MDLAADDKKTPKATGVDGIHLFDISCVSCLKKASASDGKFHCKYCGVLCEECAALHDKTPKKGHWAARLRVVVPPPTVPTITSHTHCERHVKTKISRYCIDCGELVCNTCIEDGHTECNTEDMEKMTESLSRDKDMREARLELEYIRVRNNKVCKRKMEEMKKMARQADDFVDKVLSIKEKINTLFDQMLAMIIKEKNDFCNKEAKIIAESVYKCKDVSPVFDQTRQILDEAFKTGMRSNLWIAIKKTQEIVNYYDKLISEMETDSCDVQFEFVPSDSLISLLKDAENIGKMKITSARVHNTEHIVTKRPKTRQTADLQKSKSVLSPQSQRPSFPSKVPILPSIPSVQREGSVQLKLRPLSRGTNRSKSMDEIDLRPKKLTSRDRTKTSVYFGTRPATRLNVKSNVIPKTLTLKEDDSERQLGEIFGETRDIKLSVIGKKEIAIPDDTIENCVTGCTFLKNGRLVLVDYNNKNLKVFTSDFEMKICLMLDERPWDCTGCLKSDIAITYPFVNMIEIMETSPELKVKGKIATDRKCHGVAFHRQHKLLYVACGEGQDARLQAYTMDGFVRRVIIPEIGVLHEPCFLAISRDGSRVFLSDLDNGIVGFDTVSGAMICQYKDEKVKRYWDVATDLQGHVFVVTTGPECLYVLMGDHNGQLLTTFEGDKKVCSVCFDPITNNLVVTRWQSDEIEMFKVVYN